MDFWASKRRLLLQKNLENTKIQRKYVDMGYLNLSTPEETAKDIIQYRYASSGLNNIATVLEDLLDTLNASEMKKIAENATSHAWIQRMGYTIENIDASDPVKKGKILSVLSEVLGKIKLRYRPLSPFLPTEYQPKNKKWKILLKDILN